MIWKDDATRLIELVLKMAEMSDSKHEETNMRYDLVDDLSYGYLAFSGILRAGAKAVIDLQNDLHDYMNKYQLEKQDNEEVRGFLEKCFGDREIDCINDKDMKRIMELCDQIRAEWESEENE